MAEIFERKEEGELDKLTIFTRTFKRLDEDDVSRLVDLVSEELKLRIT